MQGSVLRPYSYDEAHPYAAGQHRGIDIGADAAGEAVVAPAAGTVSFAGTVPTNGMSVTIQTADGHSVTLTHLGSILVAKGATVAEQDSVGTVGPSGTAEEAGPYVHLGIRVTSDPSGYVDPLSFLPPAVTGGGTDDPAPSQPGSGSTSSTAPTRTSAPAVSTKPGSTEPARDHVSHHEDRRAQDSPGEEVKTRPSTQHPAVDPGKPEVAETHPGQTQRRHPAQPESVLRRPVIEAAAPSEPVARDTRHELRSSALSSARRTPTGLLPLLLNGAAALVAAVAALRAARGRRRRRTESARVLHLPRPPLEHERPVSRAA